MDLSDILSNAEDQNKGRWLDLLSPWSGEPTGIRFLIAGPDSDVQARSRVRMVDDLADVSGDDGRIQASDREKVRINSLARCVIGWEITEGGKPVPFNHSNVVRVLKSAAWVQAQVDAFAADRRAFKAAE